MENSLEGFLFTLKYSLYHFVLVGVHLGCVADSER